MLLIDVLALVAQEELARLREEEQGKKKTQHRDERVRPCRLERTEGGKVNVGSSDDDDNVVAEPEITGEPEHKKITSLKFKLPLRKKETGKDDDNGAEKQDGKTGVKNDPIPLPTLPAKFTNKKRKPTEVQKATNPSLDMPTTFKNKKTKPETDDIDRPDLPAKFRNMILEKARGRLVEEAVLVIQKQLTQTDIQNHQNRFSIPLNQMINRFLSEEDDKFVGGRDAGGNCNVLEVDIIEPKGMVESINLTRWTMRKTTGHPSISYILNGDGWKNIKACNHLRVGNVVQLWAVQIEGKPCLVFVKLQ